MSLVLADRFLLMYFQMLGGGHVRRRSIDSGIEASPCARVERMKPKRRELPSVALKFEATEPLQTDSPNKSRLMEKPSIASTSSHQFGGERMIMARKGLLERQSLEDSVLMAQGEDLLNSCKCRSPGYSCLSHRIPPG